MKSLTSRLFINSILFVALSATASPVGDAFEQLKNSGEDFRVEGSACEQVTRLDMQHDYPAPAYNVETGIIYADRSRVIGELDVIVFDNQTHRVVLISEVKCWRDLRGAIKKAHEQRKRFQDTVASHIPLRFYQKDGTEYQVDQFADVPKFIAVSQEGGERFGFDRSIGLSLDESKELRHQLLSCQAKGECKRPK